MKRVALSTIILLCVVYNVAAQIHSKKYNAETNVVNWPTEFDPAKAKFYVYNEIEINASPEVIWNILLEAGMVCGRQKCRCSGGIQ